MMHQVVTLNNQSNPSLSREIIRCCELDRNQMRYVRQCSRSSSRNCRYCKNLIGHGVKGQGSKKKERKNLLQGYRAVDTMLSSVKLSLDIRMRALIKEEEEIVHIKDSYLSLYVITTNINFYTLSTDLQLSITVISSRCHSSSKLLLAFLLSSGGARTDLQ